MTTPPPPPARDRRGTAPGSLGCRWIQAGAASPLAASQPAPRTQSAAMTESEITQGRVGIAAPIFRGGLVTAGLSLVFVPTASDRKKFEIFTSKIKEAARQLSELISLP